jgi:transcription factor C subunit 6
VRLFQQYNMCKYHILLQPSLAQAICARNKLIPPARYTTLKEGFIFSAGGPIWGLDWCPLPEAQAARTFSTPAHSGAQQGYSANVADYDHLQYLAITTLPDIDFIPTMGNKGPREATSAIQIWSVTLPDAVTGEEGGMRCEMVLCIKGGSGMSVKWMPMGAWDDVSQFLARL